MLSMSFTQRAWISFIFLAVVNLATALAASLGAGTAVVWALGAVGALAAIVGGGWWVSRAASGLQKVEAALKRVDQGDFRMEIRVDSSEEFSSIVRLIQTVGNHLHTMIADVLSTSRTLTDQASKLDDAAEALAQQMGQRNEQALQVSAATEQLNASVNEIGRATQETAETAMQAKSVLQESERNMQASLASTSRIVEVVGEARATLDDLNQAVARIGSMTGTIKEIADQTNLLALNAAIEAARAGESGRGFAVVADEVRKLAERTSQSTVDINNNVANIQLVTQATLMTMEDAVAEVSNGTAAIEACSRNLAEVGKASERTVEMTHKIADSVRQQTSTADDMAKTIERMASTIEANNREAQQLATSAEALTQMATGLKSLVTRFDR